MKKSLLALVIASVLPLSAVADVVVYGKANVSVQNADEADESQIELVSNASRIGVKGGEEISSGLKAIYQFEYQTEVDDGAGGSPSQTFTQRNIYVGLQGSGGTVMAGKFDTPVKALQEKVDLFNDLEGDIAYLVNGETRASNIIQYVSPAAWGAFVMNVAYVAAEDKLVSKAPGVDDADDGTTISFAYNTPSLYLGIAAEQDVIPNLELVRLVGRFTVGAVQLGALYEESNTDADNTDADAWLVSARFNVTDKFALKAQYGDASFDYTNTAHNYNEGESISVGADYSLSKNVTLFGYYTQENSDKDATLTTAATSADDNWLGIGLDVKF